ncbi:MAG TPA: FtsK/SpoIIIE domain-containing protein [Polyangium sp.]|nr:FtsK/SpoIIIE domain-containing protein [Polyangium sp.]
MVLRREPLPLSMLGDAGTNGALPPSPRRGAREVSVTEIRNALRCPRVFALGRARGQAVAFPIGASSLGALFHRIAERFARELEGPPEPVRALLPHTPRERVAEALSAWLLGHLVDELEANPSAASMPGEIDDLVEALREFARYLAKQIEGTGHGPAEALRSFLQHAELAVDAVLDASGGIPVRVSGRIDAVYCRARDTVDVVEYKLTDETNQELDQAQVALYRYLLRCAFELDAEPLLLRFKPGLIETKLSPVAADGIVERTLLPLLGRMVSWSEHPETTPATSRRDLCPACPVRPACVETYRDTLEPRDQPPAGAARPMPDPAGRITLSLPREPMGTLPDDPDGMTEAEALAAQIVAHLKRQGVIASLGRKTVGPRLLRIEVTSPRQRVAQLDRAAQDVEHHLAGSNVRFEREEARRYFTAPRKVPRKVVLEMLLARKAAFLRERPGRFVLGEGLDGEVIAGDLADGSSCHLLVAGQTGSGKSVLLRALVVGLCHFHPPAALRFTLVDPKRVTFGGLAAGIGAHLAGPIVYDVEVLLAELDALVAEMEERYTLFEHRKVQSIDDYNDVAPAPLPRRVVVVDEFQDLVASRATRQPFLDAVKRLGAMARAAGIHLVLATQRPDRMTVPGEIKANLGGRVALRVQEVINSRIILDQGGAEELLGKGDFYADLGHGLVRGQAPMA